MPNTSNNAMVQFYINWLMARAVPGIPYEKPTYLRPISYKPKHEDIAVWEKAWSYNATGDCLMCTRPYNGELYGATLYGKILKINPENGEYSVLGTLPYHIYVFIIYNGKIYFSDPDANIVAKVDLETLNVEATASPSQGSIVSIDLVKEPGVDLIYVLTDAPVLDKMSADDLSIVETVNLSGSYSFFTKSVNSPDLDCAVAVTSDDNNFYVKFFEKGRAYDDLVLPIADYGDLAVLDAYLLDSYLIMIGNHLAVQPLYASWGSVRKIELNLPIYSSYLLSEVSGTVSPSDYILSLFWINSGIRKPILLSIPFNEEAFITGRVPVFSYLIPLDVPSGSYLYWCFYGVSDEQLFLGSLYYDGSDLLTYYARFKKPRRWIVEFLEYSG